MFMRVNIGNVKEEINMPRKPSKKFVQPEQLWEGYCQWRDSATNPQDRKLNDEFALHIWNIAKHLTQHHKFARYSEHIKQEMISDAYIKVIKNLKNIDTSKGTIFNYITRCCWTAFIVYLGKHYKNINKRKQLMLDYLEEMRTTNPLMNQELIRKIQKELGQYEIPEDWEEE